MKASVLRVRCHADKLIGAIKQARLDNTVVVID